MQTAVVQDRLKEVVERNREESLELLRELVRVSRGGEQAIQQLVHDKLKAIGCEVEMINYQPRSLSLRQEFADPAVVDGNQHVSVAGCLPGSSQGRSLMLFAQADTMPIQNNTESWEHSPFEPTIENGRMYGWAVADDLVGVAAMIAAVKAIVDAGYWPKGDLQVASTPSKKRARGIIAVLEKGYTPDGVVYVHPAESFEGLNEIKQAAAGLLSFRLTVEGKEPPTGEPGHTAFHHLAVDPLQKAFLIYNALQELNEKRGREVQHPVFQEAIGRSTNLHVAYMSCGDEHMLIRVPRQCVLAGTMTIPPGEDLRTAKEEIEGAIRGAAEADGWLREHPPKLEWLVGVTGAETSIQDPLYLAAKKAIKAVTGEEPHMNPLHTASDIRNPMLYAQIPTIGLGPLAGNLTQVGSHDEWIDVEDYIRTQKVLVRVVEEWSGVDES